MAVQRLSLLLGATICLLCLVTRADARIAQVCAGGFHTLILFLNGTIHGFGNDVRGQATPPPDLPAIAQVAAGGYFSVALSTDGRVFAWGANDYQQTSVGFLSGYRARKVVAGFFSAAVLLDDGTVRGWGSNLGGPASAPSLSNIVDLWAGVRFFIAVSSDGRLYGWGQNDVGVADGRVLSGKPVQLALGYDHAVALLDSGELATWGSNANGKTGMPAAKSFPGGVKAVSAAEGFTLVLTESGIVKFYGRNEFNNRDIEAHSGPAIKDLDAGFDHSVALLEDGSVRAFGSNQFGQSSVRFRRICWRRIPMLLPRLHRAASSSWPRARVPPWTRAPARTRTRVLDRLQLVQLWEVLLEESRWLRSLFSD